MNNSANRRLVVGRDTRYARAQLLKRVLTHSAKEKGQKWRKVPLQPSLVISLNLTLNTKSCEDDTLTCYLSLNVVLANSAF